MSTASETCWTLIEAAARGDGAERTRFCSAYAPVVERTLSLRWNHAPASQDVPDATQEVMFECLRGDGALGRVERNRAGGFRAFLFGVTRNVARRFEERAQRQGRPPDGRVTRLPQEGPDTAYQRAFDRAWAESMVRQAGERLRQWAASRGPAAQRRVAVLDLRFQEGLSEAAIGDRFGLPAKRIEKDFAMVRGEFLAMLRQVVVWNGGSEGGNPDDACRELLSLLSSAPPGHCLGSP